MGNCLIRKSNKFKKEDGDFIKSSVSDSDNNNEKSSSLFLINSSSKSSTPTTIVENKIFKILILGTGESGKSTLIKQMKIIHNDGYDETELMEFRPIILDNLVSSMKYVVTGMRLLDIPFQYKTNEELARDLISCTKYFDPETFILYPHLEYVLKTLWQDNGVREAVARGFEYELNDSALYYFENVDRLVNENYIPNIKDVVKSRIRTIGVVETEFKIAENYIMKMYDVGGQRSERRKWMHLFDDVKTLLFVVAISEYDMTLVEDSSRNRLKESLLLFNNISNNLFFRDTTTILFFNKFDLFREKIRFTERQLKYFFNEYNGPDYNPELALMFIEDQFRKCYQMAKPNKLLITHYTTATDTGNIKQVFDSVVDTILRDTLRQSTLL